MKPRKQKHYSSEIEIIADIEDAQAKAAKLATHSAELERSGQEHVRHGDDEQQKLGQKMLKQSARAFENAQREELHLLKLKDALAAFRTELLPSVVPADDEQRRVVI